VLFFAKSQNNIQQRNKNNSNNNTTFPSCPDCKKSNHPQSRCRWRLDIKCHKCGQLGYIERVFKSQQQQQQQQGEVKTIIEQPKKEQLFMASCFVTSSSTESWLIDSDCTRHMTYDQELFKKLDITAISKVPSCGSYVKLFKKLLIIGHVAGTML
jgi:hypothetical protein